MKVVDENTLELVEVEDTKISNEMFSEEDSQKQINAVEKALGCGPGEFYKKYRAYKEAEAEFKEIYEPFKKNLIQLHKDMPDLANTVMIEGCKLTYISPSTRTSIDTKKLKEEEPELAKKYNKITDVAATIRIDDIVEIKVR